MIKSINELKDLIIFAREHKLKSLKIGDINIEISDLAHIDGLPQAQELGQGLNKAVTASIPGLFDEPADPEDEELLFHSSRP